MKKFSGEVGIKCHQSCTVALVFCTKLYIKLAVSLCSFSQFSFPFNFQTANALVLKLGTLPLRCLFSNTLVAIFDIFFRSKVIPCFVPKNGPKMTCGRVFQHTVKPVLSDHPTVQGKMVVIDRWSLKQGFPETDRFFEALLNSCERCGMHTFDLRTDNSRQSGASGGFPANLRCGDCFDSKYGDEATLFLAFGR